MFLLKNSFVWIYCVGVVSMCSMIFFGVNMILRTIKDEHAAIDVDLTGIYDRICRLEDKVELLLSNNEEKKGEQE